MFGSSIADGFAISDYRTGVSYYGSSEALDNSNPIPYDYPKKEEDKMSFLCSVKSREWIVMASDSRSTTIHGSILTDKQKKIFAFPHQNLLISTVGSNCFPDYQAGAQIEEVICDCVQEWGGGSLFDFTHQLYRVIFPYLRSVAHGSADFHIGRMGDHNVPQLVAANMDLRSGVMFREYQHNENAIVTDGFFQELTRYNSMFSEHLTSINDAVHYLARLVELAKNASDICEKIPHIAGATQIGILSKDTCVACLYDERTRAQSSHRL